MHSTPRVLNQHVPEEELPLCDCVASIYPAQAACVTIRSCRQHWSVRRNRGMHSAMCTEAGPKLKLTGILHRFLSEELLLALSMSPSKITEHTCMSSYRKYVHRLHTPFRDHTPRHSAASVMCGPRNVFSFLFLFQSTPSS
jgi:hypothetical protein